VQVDGAKVDLRADVPRGVPGGRVELQLASQPTGNSS
jgi:hypothetical protein